MDILENVWSYQGLDCEWEKNWMIGQELIVAQWLERCCANLAASLDPGGLV